MTIKIAGKLPKDWNANGLDDRIFPSLVTDPRRSHIAVVVLDTAKITKDIASDAKVRLSVPRSHFNELAREGKIRHWREAFESGTVKATGPAEILRLIQSVVERQEERSRTRKLRTK